MHGIFQCHTAKVLRTKKTTGLLVIYKCTDNNTGDYQTITVEVEVEGSGFGYGTSDPQPDEEDDSRSSGERG